ncbi:hypothetical protein KAU33_00220 [Candidatus Dependentiae bacterium]|nr:hypothetical protein [Candidatus Dependentiae bacterium]
MAKFKYFILFVLVICLLSGCSFGEKKTSESSAQLTKKPSEVKPTTVVEDLYVRYNYSCEVKSDTIHIKNNKLTFTYVDTSKLADLPIVMEQRPYWTNKEFITIEKDLTDQEVKKLKELIKTSGFFKLNSIEGMTDENQRYYPYFITVKLDGKTKLVEYRSNPDGPSMPKAFSDVMDRLNVLAGAGQ